MTTHLDPDRVVAAVGTRSRLPLLPWYIPAAAGRSPRIRLSRHDYPIRNLCSDLR
jgi:hypothetical protein